MDARWLIGSSSVMLVALCACQRHAQVEVSQQQAAAEGKDDAPLRHVLPTPLTEPADDAQLVTTLTTAEGLLSLGRPDAALSALAQLPPTLAESPAALCLHAWTLRAARRFADLSTLLAAATLSEPEVDLLSALALARAGETRAAARGLTELWWKSPDTALGVAALRELGELPCRFSGADREALRTLVPRPSLRTYQEDDEQAADVLKSLARKAKAGGLLACELDYALGVFELSHERFPEAVAYLEHSLAVRGGAQELRRATELRLAEALRRQGSYQEAQQRFASLSRDTRDRWGTLARAAAGQMAIENQRYEEAEHIFRTQLLENPLGEARQQALWGLGWVAFRTAAFRQARQFFHTLLVEAPYGKLAPAAIYWGARSLEEQNERAQAESELAALLLRFPLDYYALRARERLGDKNPVPAALPEPGLRPEVKHLAALAKARLERRVRPLLARLVSRLDAATPAELTVLSETAASFGTEAQRSRITALSCARFAQAKEGCSTLAAAFTTPPATLLRQAAQHERVDARWLLAAAKVASDFGPGRTGPRGELGVLQIPRRHLRSLWQESHNRTRREPTLAEILRDDALAKLSTRYYGRVVRSFGTRVDYALAALHAGPGAVTRWREARGDLPPEIFVEEIPYSETATWVRRVLASALLLGTDSKGKPKPTVQLAQLAQPTSTAKP